MHPDQLVSTPDRQHLFGFLLTAERGPSFIFHNANFSHLLRAYFQFSTFGKQFAFYVRLENFFVIFFVISEFSFCTPHVHLLKRIGWRSEKRWFLSDTLSETEKGKDGTRETWTLDQPALQAEKHWIWSLGSHLVINASSWGQKDRQRVHMLPLNKYDTNVLSRAKQKPTRRQSRMEQRPDQSHPIVLSFN